MWQKPIPPPVATDGFPQGHTSSEGVACDLARAFIHHDWKLFQAICIPPNGSKDYERFLSFMRDQFQKEAKRTQPSPMGPKKIDVVYVARPLSKNGPNSYAYAVMGYKAIRFVDVEVTLHDGKRATNRTFVIQTSDDRWFVHPAPQVSPLLCAGLNEEPPSKIRWKKP